MSFLQAHVPQDALLGQPKQTGPSQGLRLREQDQAEMGTAMPFQAMLLQQLMGELDRTVMTLDDGEGAANALSTRWDPRFALAQPSDPAPVQPRALRQPGGQGAATARALQLIQAGHHKAPAGVVPSALVPKPGPEPITATPGLAKAGPPPASDADGFLGKLAGIAQATAGALGLSPHLLLAQAALETGWGRKAIKAATGQESYNLFGIKAGKHWTGGTVEVQTTEYVNGTPQQKVESFRAYSSYAESFADYAKLIKHRYGDAMAHGATAEGFGQALQAKGYATDPNYAQKIARVAQSVAYRLATLPEANTASA